MRKPNVKVWRFPGDVWLIEANGGMSAGSDGDLGMLLAIADATCDLGSRYSAQRLTIKYEPGDKHHDIHPLPCAECDCGCEPDRSTPPYRLDVASTRSPQMSDAEALSAEGPNPVDIDGDAQGRTP